VGDLSASLTRGGYAAIFLSVILGSLGLPIPEDGVFVLAGYLAREGRLSWLGVVVVGVLAVMTGDNLGYWIGRRLGYTTVERGARWAWVSPAHIARIRRLVARYGAVAVFLARFVSGVRILAGPLAGSAGLPPLTFLAANTLAALTYVPLMIGAGYAFGEGLGAFVEDLWQRVDPRSSTLLLAVAAGAVLVLGRRAVHHLAQRQEEPETALPPRHY
jgi:membrane protein DedA with SNARE-associated domain